MSETSVIPGGTDEGALTYPGWSVTAGSTLGVFVSFASLLVSTFGVFLKPLGQEFSWSRSAVSTAFAIAALTFALFSPLIGYLIDRFGARRIILPCLIAFGCSFASLSLLTGRLWHLYAMFLILGAVGSGTAQMAYSRTVSTWFDAKRGQALGFLVAGSAAGAIVLPPAAQFLITHVGWRSSFAALGMMALALGVPANVFLVRDRFGIPRGRTGAFGLSLREGLKSRVFWILIGVLVLSSLGHNGVITHLAALLTDRGVSAGSAAMGASAMGLAGLGGRMITGLLVDRYFAPHISVGMLSLTALGLYLFSRVHSISGGVCVAVLVGFGMGGEAVIIPYLLTKYFGLRCFAQLYGLTWTAYAMAGALGPVMMGKAFDTTSSYTALAQLLSVLSLAAATLMLLAPRYSSASKDCAR